MTIKTLGTASLIAAICAAPAMAQEEIALWYHGAGNNVEGELINALISDFNASQSDYSVVIEEFPQESYNDSVEAAALAGNLPCILDVDGPVMPRWAWAGYLQPLPVDKGIIADFLPGTKGIWNDKLYSIGYGMPLLHSMRGNRPWMNWSCEHRLLKNRGIKMIYGCAGSCQGNWPIRLRHRSRHGMDRRMVSLRIWPFLQSFGGDMIDRDSYSTADGVLNGEAAQAFGEWWQSPVH